VLLELPLPLSVLQEHLLERSWPLLCHSAHALQCTPQEACQRLIGTGSNTLLHSSNKTHLSGAGDASALLGATQLHAEGPAGVPTRQLTTSNIVSRKIAFIISSLTCTWPLACTEEASFIVAVRAVSPEQCSRCQQDAIRNRIANNLQKLNWEAALAGGSGKGTCLVAC
jgi:hypothetical protein